MPHCAIIYDHCTAALPRCQAQKCSLGHLLFTHAAAHSYQLLVDESDGAGHRHGVVGGLLADLAVLRGERDHPRVDVDEIRRGNARSQVPLRSRRHHQR